MSCAHCANTGSLSKDLHGHLDCTRCNVASERALVEHWVRQNTPNCNPTDAWLIYGLGKVAALIVVDELAKAGTNTNSRRAGVN
jgi:hypothetical protein